MIEIKVVLIRGDIINRDKVRVSTLEEKINEKIKQIQQDVGISDVDVTIPVVNFPTSASGGDALLMVKCEAKPAKENNPLPAPRKKKK